MQPLWPHIYILFACFLKCIGYVVVSSFLSWTMPPKHYTTSSVYKNICGSKHIWLGGNLICFIVAHVYLFAGGVFDQPPVRPVNQLSAWSTVHWRTIRLTNRSLTNRPWSSVRWPTVFWPYVLEFISQYYRLRRSVFQEGVDSIVRSQWLQMLVCECVNVMLCLSHRSPRWTKSTSRSSERTRRRERTEKGKRIRSRN